MMAAVVSILLQGGSHEKPTQTPSRNRHSRRSRHCSRRLSFSWKGNEINTPAAGWQLFFLSRLLRVPQLRSSRLLMRCWCSELVLLLGSPAPSSRSSAAFLDWNDPNFS